MHTLVDMHYLTRKEFERNLRGLNDEDAQKRIEPMNCISWIVAHVASQYQAFFVDWPQGKELDSRYKAFATGNPTSRPTLEEAMTLWQDVCKNADVWLQAATGQSLQEKSAFTLYVDENGGTLLVRSTFHTWCHLGEISAIRQILGHRPPEFVNMHHWSYDGT